MNKFIPFQEIEHTADLAMQIFGRSIEELFHNAHQGFYSLIFGNLNKIRQMENSLQDKGLTKALQFEEASLEDLLHSFLSELNFHLQSKKTIFFPLFNLKIDQTVDGFHLKSRGKELPIPSNYLADITEIKAVTYHGLKIKRQNGLWSVTVIFDI